MKHLPGARCSTKAPVRSNSETASGLTGSPQDTQQPPWDAAGLAVRMPVLEIDQSRHDTYELRRSREQDKKLQGRAWGKVKERCRTMYVVWSDSARTTWWLGDCMASIFFIPCRWPLGRVHDSLDWFSLLAKPLHPGSVCDSSVGYRILRLWIISAVIHASSHVPW